MENRSDTTETSSETLANCDFQPPLDRDTIVMLSVPTTPESEDGRLDPVKDKEIETMVSDKEIGSTSNGDKEETRTRVLSPEKYEVDGSKKKGKEKESDVIPFKEIFEALIRNSGEKKVEEEKALKKQSCVEMLKSMGLKFP